jgi:hypothetical protein
MRWFAWIAFVLFVSVAAAAPWYTNTLLFRWTQSEGPVVQYECELSDGSLHLTPIPALTFPAWAGDVAVRCRGMDIAQVAGPWSPWSKTHGCKRHKSKSSYRCSL